MGQLIDLETARIARAPLPQQNAVPTLTRTPELAFILVMFEQLPRQTRNRVIFQVMALAERCPDCEASKEAAEIARQLSECFDGGLV